MQSLKRRERTVLRLESIFVSNFKLEFENSYSMHLKAISQ